MTPKPHPAAAIAALLLIGNFSHAQTVSYSQDFSASNPIDESGEIITDNNLIFSTSQNITGGSLSNQAADGDYTINLIRSNPVDEETNEVIDTGNGYIFNAAPDFSPQGQNVSNPGAGFTAIDQNFTFTTGIISYDDQGVARNGSVTINANSFNTGGEFLSLNLIQIEEDDVTGEVTLTIDYNAFADFGPNGNESIIVTTNFNSPNDLDRVSIIETETNDAVVAEVFTHTLVEGSNATLVLLAELLKQQSH